jgi:LysM repeat protein
MRRAWILLFLVPVISGCIGEGGTPFDPSVSSTGPEGPVPYHTASPSASSNVLPAMVEVIPPTPTPIIHIVMEGETLVGIADHYGISLEALQAANPSVQPSALTVGAQIMVPTGGSISGEATPTPAALPILQARCWLETSGGAWCFALLKNEYAETLENISAQFTLRDAGGGNIQHNRLWPFEHSPACQRNAPGSIFSASSKQRRCSFPHSCRDYPACPGADCHPPAAWGWSLPAGDVG